MGSGMGGRGGVWSIGGVGGGPLSHTIETLRQRTRQRSGIPDHSPEAETEHIIFLHRDDPSLVEPTNSHLIIATLLITKERDGLVSEVEISTHADHSV